MFNSVQYVREICRQRGIAVSQLEKACGFSNGYLNPKKMSRISYDRAVLIAGYLDIPAEEILNGPNSLNSSVLTKKDERDISKDLEAIMADLEHAGDLMFDGNPMSEEARESMRSAIALGLKAVKLLNKETYTPHKYKKG